MISLAWKLWFRRWRKLWFHLRWKLWYDRPTPSALSKTAHNCAKRIITANSPQAIITAALCAAYSHSFLSDETDIHNTWKCTLNCGRWFCFTPVFSLFKAIGTELVSVQYQESVLFTEQSLTLQSSQKHNNHAFLPDVAFLKEWVKSPNLSSAPEMPS